MITDVNPFIYSHPVAPEDIIDRDEETMELLRNAVGGHFVRLFAPRKYGKTSLLKRALRDGEKQEGLIPVLVDLYRVSSIADVTIRFERAYSKHLKGPLRGKVEEFLQKAATDLVAANNVRVYHPVKCADSSATSTSTGYCPNDTTGLFPIA